MAFVPFEMERYQSTFEHEVEFNLSESGVHPLTVGELSALVGVDPGEVDGLLLEYIQSNGSRQLRERVAAFHPGADADSVVITNGSCEANFVSTWEICGDGGQIVFMEPNYFQIHGVAQNFGATVREWWLESDTWQPSLARLESLVDDETRLIVVTSPNNPTGARFDTGFIDGVVAVAERVGAWILSDEVYRGAELDGNESPTFWGRYDRVIVTGGLSKAYALPGLRIGWAVTSSDMAQALWARKDYTTISPGAVSEHLAARALTTEGRAALLNRTRGILRSNWSVLEPWLAERSDVLSWRAPDAGAIALVRYDLPIDSFELGERARKQAGCLLVPGAHFRLPQYLRIGFGPQAARLAEGLRRLGSVIDPLR
jgi:aspartate/methionine/tyrosine aminotransferase